MKPLSDDDIPIVNDFWIGKHNGSEFLFKKLAKLNTNIGAFTSDGKLVAWCLR